MIKHPHSTCNHNSLVPPLCVSDILVHLCVFVCVCVRVRACVCACACVRVCVCVAWYLLQIALPELQLNVQGLSVSLQGRVVSLSLRNLPLVENDVSWAAATTTTTTTSKITTTRQWTSDTIWVTPHRFQKFCLAKCQIQNIKIEFALYYVINLLFLGGLGTQ